MNALRRTSPLPLHLAALSLSGAGLPAATSGSASNDGPLKIDAMLKQWEYEDERKMDYVLRVESSPTATPSFHKWNVASWQGVVMPMLGTKNVSPKRVAKRRRRNKAARKARRRQRRQNAEPTDR